MSSEQKISPKPKVYQLTDQFVIYIIYVVIILSLFFFIFTLPLRSALAEISELLFFSLGGYLGVKYIFYSHAKNNPSINKSFLKTFIGFFWGFGMLSGLVVPIPSIFIYGISDIYSTIDGLGFFMITGLSVALSASHSWKYLSIVE